MGNFIDAVAKGDPQLTVTSITESVRSDIISHLCDIAVRTGERITWDPKTQKMMVKSSAERVTSLAFARCSALTDDQLRSLKAFRNLRQLTLRDAPITPPTPRRTGTSQDIHARSWCRPNRPPSKRSDSG
jgi:hypothetical protein